MWETADPKPVKLIVGILAADEDSLKVARDRLVDLYGFADLASQIWPFTQTEYYKGQTGENIVRQFMTFEKLIDPGDLARIKHQTNDLEETLAGELNTPFPRPINLDPGIIEPSKLILASTKNFSHRIYIGDRMYAEVTLTFNKGTWENYPYTFPDYKETRYHDFLGTAREKLVEQLRQMKID